MSKVGSNSALHDAVEDSDYDKVASILSRGQDINALGKFGRTPVHIAAKTGNIRILECLLQSNSINLNIKSVHGFTPVYIAAVANNEEVLTMILSRPGIDVDAIDLGGMSALVAAACNGCPVGVLASLITAGASTSLRDSIGRKALDWAREKHFNDIYVFLVQYEK
jgi:ankyrin repeat protein